MSTLALVIATVALVVGAVNLILLILDGREMARLRRDLKGRQ